jgi:hypothetical protein
MRKLIFMTLLSAGLLVTFTGAKAQDDHHYVAKHPSATVGNRPARPSPNHVWVGSEWEWRDNRYVETPGHWALPPSGHKTWVAGRWSSTSKGSYWKPGHWS